MNIDPRHTFIMAVKYSFLSQCMKTVSIVYVQRELEVNEENRYVTSVNGKQKSSANVGKPSVCDTFHKGLTKKSSLKKLEINIMSVILVIKDLPGTCTWKDISVFIEKNLLCVTRFIKDLHRRSALKHISMFALVKKLMNLLHVTEDLQIYPI